MGWWGVQAVNLCCGTCMDGLRWHSQVPAQCAWLKSPQAKVARISRKAQGAQHQYSKGL